MERIDGAKETGIHPVADGETHGGVPAGGKEDPAAGRARDRVRSDGFSSNLRFCCCGIFPTAPRCGLRHDRRRRRRER
jgi:hypothetical protein